MADLLLAAIVAALVATLAAVAATVFAFGHGWLVARPEFKRMEADRDGWRNMALSLMSANRQLRETNRQAVQTVREFTEAVEHRETILTTPPPPTEPEPQRDSD